MGSSFIGDGIRFRYIVVAILIHVLSFVSLLKLEDPSCGLKAGRGGGSLYLLSIYGNGGGGSGKGVVGIENGKVKENGRHRPKKDLKNQLYKRINISSIVEYSRNTRGEISKMEDKGSKETQVSNNSIGIGSNKGDDIQGLDSGSGAGSGAGGGGSGYGIGSGSGYGSQPGSNGYGIGVDPKHNVVKREDNFKKSVASILLQKIKQYIKYPYVARVNSWEGRIIVKVKVDNGVIDSFRIEKSSGYKVLDDEVINAFTQLKKSRERLTNVDDPVEVIVPVVFKLE